jgi:hypothetical protein
MCKKLGAKKREPVPLDMMLTNVMIDLLRDPNSAVSQALKEARREYQRPVRLRDTAKVCNPMNSFKDILGVWPSVSEFAKDMNIPYQTASSMRNRDAVDGKYFDRIVSAAQKIGHPEVTHELLCRIAAAKHERVA